MQHRRPVVVGIVAAHQVLGRVPRLVRIEEVDPQEERPGAVVALQPGGGGRGGAGAEGVGLGADRVRPHVQVDQRAAEGLRAAARLGARHRPADRVVHVQQGEVPFLAAVLEAAVEADLQARLEQVRRVADELREVALLGEQRGDVVGGAVADRLPAVVRPAGAPAGEVGAVRDGREAAHGEAGELGGTLAGEAVELRRAHRPRRAVSEVVAPEGVGDQDDDVGVLGAGHGARSLRARPPVE